MSYNKAILSGRLVSDPELRRTGSGIAVTSFSLAVDRQGNKEGAVDFIDCVAWRKTAEFLCHHFHKGKEALVDGELQTRTYTAKDGSKRKVTEVNVSEVRFVGKRDIDSDNGYHPEETQEEAGYYPVNDDDSDLPF